MGAKLWVRVNKGSYFPCTVIRTVTFTCEIQNPGLKMENKSK